MDLPILWGMFDAGTEFEGYGYPQGVEKKRK